jgi:beta-ureidopropionase / N-carbamoyl-L-amino-acid hydrolase
MTSLSHINTAPLSDALTALDGLYEHSPWVMARALGSRPFASVAALEHALATAVTKASLDEQLALIRAHPELAGKAMVAKNLTADSSNEQSTAGLTHCSAEEFDKLQNLNAAYKAKFGWPFILAVRGPRGVGLSRAQIISTFERRLDGHPDFERAECLRNIHRVAQIRLADKLCVQPDAGHELWDWHEDLSQHSDEGFKERGELTVTYLSNAHRACQQAIAQRMRECGFDEVFTDVLGNVVGRYYKNSIKANEYAGLLPINLQKTAPWLMTGSHFDTVRNGGKYDGRLGILLPLMAVKRLHAAGKRLPFGLEVVAFAEEEGQRYKATFLASSALVGNFDVNWLDQKDATGQRLGELMAEFSNTPEAALPAAIAAVKRDPSHYLGFVEVHVEQGPVLNGLNLPLGVVTSINGSARYMGEVVGQASHAGTTPMDARKDAAAAVAELMLYAEQRAQQDDGSVGTVGMLHVPNGSINVVPGRCAFSLDLRAPNDAQLSALVEDVLQKLGDICARRGVASRVEQTMRASAAPSNAALQQRWEQAVAAVGLPVFKLPSGAGHDAMKLHQAMPQAMLFVRGENAGISHNPLESTTSHDMQLALHAFEHLLQELAS